MTENTTGPDAEDSGFGAGLKAGAGADNSGAPQERKPQRRKAPRRKAQEQQSQEQESQERGPKGETEPEARSKGRRSGAASSDVEGSDAGEERPKSSTRSRRRPKKRAKAAEPAGDAPAESRASAPEEAPAFAEGADAPQASETASSEAAASEEGAEKPKRKRRGSRGGRRRKRGSEASGPEEGDDAIAAEAPVAGTDGEDARSADSDPDSHADRGDDLDREGDRDGDDEAPKPAKKARRSRKRRARRGKSEDEPGDDGEAPVAEPADEVVASDAALDDDDEDSAPSKKRRRRGKRGGRRRKAKSVETALEIESIPGEDDDLPELAELPDDAELVRDGGEADEDAQPKGKKKKKRGRKKGKSDEDEEKPAPAPKRTGVILVNAMHAEETRVAVVEDGRIMDLQMTVPRYSSYVNDIYRGRVVNLESAIGAAFVDFGQGRNGFLHASDVLPAYGDDDWNLEKLLTTQIDSDDSDDWDEAEAEAAAQAEDGSGDDSDDPEAAGDDDGEDKPKAKAKGRKKKARTKAKKAGGRSGKKASSRSSRTRRPRLPIEKLLSKGQMVVCQITKDAIGDKGPTLTTYISIPGRYLVLMPSLARTGVSRKIEDEKERRRLKKILQALDIPAGMGVIVRTAGVGKTKADIKRDLEYLLLAWEDFSRRLISGRNPAPLYQESDVSVRTMRDLFSATIDKVIVDDEDVYKRMVEFTEKLMPENVERIHLHEGARPILHAHGVEQDFEKIFQRRVELPSGGSIVIDQTEALVAIDVNSGRTRDEGADFEDIALKTNLEAAPEIARQIRLRDMGGIIVVDFIDMMRQGNRRQVERAFRSALSADRARSKLGRISQFGLLELTRQRLGPGLSKLIYDNCQHCRGTGRRRTASSRTHAVLRRMGHALTMKGFTKVEVRSHPDVIGQLKGEYSADLERMKEDSGRDIVLTSIPDQVEDSVLRYLRADGREVRPGGRRKR